MNVTKYLLTARGYINSCGVLNCLVQSNLYLRSLQLIKANNETVRDPSIFLGTLSIVIDTTGHNSDNIHDWQTSLTQTLDTTLWTMG